MSDERELALFWLKVLYSNSNHIESAEEQAENIASMKQVIELNPLLSPPERAVLSYVYKNPVSSRRTAIRQVTAVLLGMDKSFLTIPISDPSLPPRVRRMREFLDRLYTELRDICLDLVNLIDEYLLPVASEPGQRLFYEKMKGDYFRYICENRDDPNFDTYRERARLSYQTALEIAQADLAPTGADYLGLVLNYTVFLSETLQCQSDAIELSKRVFEETVDMADTIDPDAEMILRLLRENQTRWTEQRNETQL